ncbi:MAG: NADH-quinone oxidoreductase subunit NuoG [Betaproteobacteria bacterium]
MINLEIDGKAVQVENGATVMEAANKLGTFIPHFCYHKKLSIAANCRMCLVQVEKAPKPLPACATPATEGMKVLTNSEYAKTAQKGVMEFLLINHPLDCPICDQGGECQLQDLAVGYGSPASRYQEEKRVVVNKNLGPLISTDMTRCIHCTRCVRFGQEVAGIMELGQAGRGEHSEILAFVGKTVDSELSGNVIDLCPVGALTSKPFRYTARSWELSRRKSISPHDGLGSNLVVQVKQDRVMRVLPLDNEAINECWLSDRDRFSYEGLNDEDRLTRPMMKVGDAWSEVDWPVALQAVAEALKRVKERHGAASIAAMASPQQTLEELYLLDKVVRGLGSSNIDTRLRQVDTSADGKVAGARWLGMRMADIGALQSVLVVGSTLRKEHPLIANRLRQAAKRGLQVNIVHVADDDLLMKIANKAIVRPGEMASLLGAIAKALVDIKKATLPGDVANAVAALPVSPEARAIAQNLAENEKTAVFLGNFTQHHPQYSLLHVLGQEIARLTGGSFGLLGEAANSVGAAALGIEPGKDGLCAQGMVSQPRKAYVLLGVEPELDCYDPARTMAALQAADFVVSLATFKGAAPDYADVVLPIAPFTETAGTFVNMEGTVQSFNGVVKPLGEARPAWKVLRVLGNLLGLDGFEQDSVNAIRSEIAPDLQALVNAKLNNTISGVKVAFAAPPSGVERVAEVPIYAADSLVRHASSLQKTTDARNAKRVLLAKDVADKLGVGNGAVVRVTQEGNSVILTASIDAGLAPGCARVAAALAETAVLGAMSGSISLEKAALAAAAE